VHLLVAQLPVVHLLAAQLQVVQLPAAQQQFEALLLALPQAARLQLHYSDYFDYSDSHEVRLGAIFQNRKNH